MKIKKKVQNSTLVLHFFCNFGSAELTWHSEKLKINLAFLSFFRNFAPS